jgi:hypothetical protein
MDDMNSATAGWPSFDFEMSSTLTTVLQLSQFFISDSATYATEGWRDVEFVVADRPVKDVTA